MYMGKFMLLKGCIYLHIHQQIWYRADCDMCDSCAKPNIDTENMSQCYHVSSLNKVR